MSTFSKKENNLGWPLICYQKLSQFHRIHQGTEWSITQQHVINFLIAQRRAKKKTFTRFQIVEALTPFQKRKPKLQNQAYYALKLVFELVLNRDFGKIDAIRSTKAVHNPSIMSRNEVAQGIAQIRPPYQLIAKQPTAAACGSANV